MAKIQFDFKNPDMSVVRSVVIRRLREDPGFRQLDQTGAGFMPYVEMSGSEISKFGFLANEVCWQFLCSGILAPGNESADDQLPLIHLTFFGRSFVETGEWPVHDPRAYLARMASRVSVPDETAVAYLTESLNSFEHGSYVASAVMLGIAAERVFLLICEATCGALSSSSEQQAFEKLLSRLPIKPKLDWLHRKFTELQKSAPAGFPDNASLMVTGIYDLLRAQRNDLGHPRDRPPRLTPEDVFDGLQLFPRYLQAAESVRLALGAAKI